MALKDVLLCNCTVGYGKKSWTIFELIGLVVAKLRYQSFLQTFQSCFNLQLYPSLKKVDNNISEFISHVAGKL